MKRSVVTLLALCITGVPAASALAQAKGKSVCSLKFKIPEGDAASVSPDGKPLAGYVAEMVSKALGGTYSATKMADGVPEPIAMVAVAHYSDSADTCESVMSELRKASAEFDGAWSAYEARKAVVKEAVAAAEALASSGKLAEAHKTLAAVVTPIELDKRGLPATPRKALEARDAEVDALVATAKLFNASHEYEHLSSLTPALAQRRHAIGEREDERLLWMGYADSRRFFGLPVGQRKEAAKAFVAVQQRLKKAFDGELRALAVLEQPDKLGLKRAEVEDAKSAKKGEWVVVDMKLDEVENGKGAYKWDAKWNQAYDCRTTDRVVAIDWTWSVGKLIYEEKCKYRPMKSKGNVGVTFAGTPPEWAKPGQELRIVARVAAAGPAWKLERAVVIDDRWKDAR